MPEEPLPNPSPEAGGAKSAPPSLAGKGAGGLGRWLCFLVFISLWTWKLLEPSPVPEAIGDAIPMDWKYFASKCAHVGGYTFLTLLAAWLPLNRRGFWVVVALLAAHGVTTEILQHVMGWGRTGKVTDVLIDWFGISLGLLALWSARRKKEKGKRKNEDTNQSLSLFFLFPFSFFLAASARFLA